MYKFRVRFGAPVELFGEMVGEVEGNAQRQVTLSDTTIFVTDYPHPCDSDGGWCCPPIRRATIWPPPRTSFCWYEELEKPAPRSEKPDCPVCRHPVDSMATVQSSNANGDAGLQVVVSCHGRSDCYFYRADLSDHTLSMRDRIELRLRAVWRDEVPDRPET